MNILCFGAGAIGSYIAGSLALIGNPLVYIEQPRFIEALKTNGVRIEGTKTTKQMQLFGFEPHQTELSHYVPGMFIDITDVKTHMNDPESPMYGADFHPTYNGHRQIANRVLKVI